MTSSRDARATSDPYPQHIKRELETDLDSEASSARASKRLKMTGEAECFTTIETIEERRYDPTPRRSILAETSPDSESTSGDIQPSNLPALIEKTDTSSVHSATPPNVPSALQNPAVEVLDKAACYRLAYQETKKKYKLLKSQMLEEKKIWREEEDKRAAKEVAKLVEEQKRLSRLLEISERRLAKLRKRSLSRGLKSTKDEARDLNVEMQADESCVLASTEDSVSSNQTPLYTQKSQQRSQGERSPQSPTHPSHNSTSSRAIQSLPLSAPPDTSSSTGQRIHEHNPQETTAPRQTQARSVSFQDSGMLAGPRSSNVSNASSIPPVAAPERASQTENSNGQVSSSSTEHSPFKPNVIEIFDDPFEALRTHKENGHQGGGMSLQPKFSNVPIALPRSDAELVRIGKIPNRHERHHRAPHVFGSQGRVLAAYYRLGDIVDVTGASVWTQQELRRLFPGLGRAVPGCEREFWYKGIYKERR